MRYTLLSVRNSLLHTLRLPYPQTINPTMKNNRSNRLLSFLVSSSLLTVPFANAAMLTWDAGGAGGAITNGAGAWLGAGLWNDASVASTWTSGDDAIFAGPATAGGAVTLASPTTVNSFTFSPSFTGTYTLGTAGQAMTLNAGITKNASSGLVTIVSPITLGGTQTWTNNSTNKLQISSFVTTSAGQILTLAGTGEVNFPTSTTGITGDGSIIVDGVYLNLISGGNQAVNNYTGTTTVKNGGEILYFQTGPNIGTGNIDVQGGILTGYFNQGFTRPFGTLSGQFQITDGISGFGVNGSNTINFSNVTSVQWGSASFSPTKFVLGGGRSGGTVTFAENIDLNNADRTVTTPVGSGGGVLSGSLSTSTGTAGLIKEGAGTLTLSNASNTYNGNTTVSQGVLTANTSGALPGFATPGRVIVAGGATIGVRTAGWTAANIDALRGAATWSATSSRLGFDTSGGNFSYGSNITDALSINKIGTNTLTLTGTNTYTGGTILTAGTLSVGSATAISSTGTISFNGGTIQSSDATLRTLSNVIAVNADISVGTTGNLTFSDTGSTALGATRTFTIGGGNTTFAQAFTGSGVGITKAGAGILTLTGNNSYTGATTINAGKLVLNNGTVTGSAVSFAASNTAMDVLGGSAVTSIWNLNGGNFGTTNNTYNNIQVLIDGKGTAGSARVIGVGILVWGKTASNSTLTLTDGGQMNVNGEVRIGDPYYNTNGNSRITIGGGTATSTFTGNSGQAFYIGYGDRENSNNNVVTVSSGGVLTSVGNMFVGDVNNQQGNDLASTANKLTVSGTGTASMVSITVGNARTAGPSLALAEKADANVVEVTTGGTLTTSGVNYIGRATANFTQSNANTLTVTGAGSSWAAGNQNVFVGFTSNSGAVSNNNILTVSSGGTVTGINGLTVGSGTGTETGNQLVVNGSLTATSVSISNGNSLAGNGTINGAVTIGATGTVIPGTSVGTLTINGNLTFSEASDDVGTLNYELDTIAASDKIVLPTGILNIGTDALGLSDFSFTDLGGLQNGTYTLIQTDQAIVGGLLAADVNGTLGLATIALQISVDGTDLELVVSGLGGGDTTPPTLTSITDDVSGGPVNIGATVTYTVTFNEDIDDTSVTAADFNNNGTAGITVGAISETSPGVFTVAVTVNSPGSLKLRIPTGSVIEDVALNDLVVPVEDDTTITVRNAYQTWALTNAISSAPGADKDGDGVNNAIEFILGGDVGTNDLSKLPEVTMTATDMIVTFERKRSSIDGITGLEIEVGTTLTGWPTSYTVGATTGTSDAGVVVTENSPAGFDTITLTVPKGTDPKKFARLSGIVTP